MSVYMKCDKEFPGLTSVQGNEVRDKSIK